MIDYPEQGCMINSAYYAGELKWLCQEIARKRPEKLSCGVLLLQDSAPAHMSLPRLLRLNVDLKSFLNPYILLIWLLLTSICSQN